MTRSYAPPIDQNVGRTRKKDKLSQSSVWAIPLGGIGEFGMNMLVVRTADDIIVIDAGLMFPEQELLGVDIVIPDTTYLKQNKRLDPRDRSDARA